jgi:membrane protein YdbS with pleckstrin-like domain
MSGRTERAAAWVYSGVFAGLVSAFRLPERPPTLPTAPGEEAHSFKPDFAFVRYLKFYFWLLLAITDIPLTIGWLILLVAFPIVGVLTFPVYLVLAFVPDIVAYIAIHLRYDTTWYVLTSRSLRIRRGIWIIHETTITYDNIQNVAVRQGPVQRHFGIATLQVQTAGGGGGGAEHGHAAAGAHVGLLEGIAEAPRIRDLIMQRVATSRSAGLGDEAQARGPVAGPSGWSAAHLAMLGEIRAAARGLIGQG